MTVDTLYRVESIIDGWPHRNQRYNGVEVIWLRMDRRFNVDDETSVASVAPLIKDFDQIPERYDRLYAVDLINELFTQDEAHALSTYLREKHGTPTTITPVPLPLNVRTPDGVVYMPLTGVPGGGPIDFYLLSKEDDYALPFKVEGYYNVEGMQPTGFVPMDDPLVAIATRTPTTGIEIKFEPPSSQRITLCRLCAMVFHPQFELTPVVYDGGARVGEVCDGCYPSDEQALRQRLRERAALLRTVAVNMEADADRIIVMPSQDDWIAQRKAYRQAMEQEYRESRIRLGEDPDADTLPY